MKTAPPLTNNTNISKPNEDEILENLTNQELKILRLAATDLSNKEIADHLNISNQTVKKHRQNIYEKLNLHGKCEIRKFMRRLGWF